MALGRMRRDREPSGIPKLNITSMMDMFTIILIFLLFSFSNEPEPIMDKSLQLPKSTAQSVYKEEIKIVLTQENLKVGDKTLAAIIDGEIQGFDAKNPKDSELFTKLKFFIDEEIKSNEIKNKIDMNNSPEKQSHILFLCDKRLPFKTVNSVVKTAAAAGYPNFKFTVLQK